jgi:murein DD-endopeptidase MepM/ murein hydrolase activator NlpD
MVFLADLLYLIQGQNMGGDSGNYTDDGSVELTFRVVFDNALDAYYIYPMCSSNGRSRVLDSYNTSGLAAGCNVQIYNKNSFTSYQTFDIISVGNNKFKIVMASNNNLALTAYGTSNGSGTGTSSSSAGNVYLSTYNDLLSQQWYIEEAADNHEDYYASLNWAYMFRGDWIPVHISCDYGYRSHPITGADEFHTGIDISEYGIDEESIYSVAAGKVLKIIDEPNPTSGRGHCIIIEHSDTVYGSTTKLCTMYMHMKDPSPFYKNDNVTVNDIIGYVGSTGGSTGPHLHFSVISNGSTGGHNASNTIEPMFFYENITFTFDEY